jgi:phospholipid transport system substrate-binding protein
MIRTLTVLLTLCFASSAWAGAPSDQLRAGVERVFKILKDPALQGEEKTPQRTTSIIRVASEIFDFGEMAKRSLGQHWEQRTPAERADFVQIFTDLVQRSYISKVDQHGSEKMTIQGETIEGEYAVVRTTIILSRGGAMPLDYRMRSTGDRWQAYDLSIDGISLVANYRAQFNKIIRTTSYDSLVSKLKSHQADFTAPSAAPAAAKTSR